jgi:ABC-2 type transport system ATP-binding protein
VAGLLFSHEGEIKVAGINSATRHPDMLSDLFFMPEEFYVPPVQIENYVEIYAPFYPAFDRAMLKDLLVEFELGGKQKLTQLSYGQKKKFLLSFGLATNAQLCILDEPTNGLDIPSKSQFRRVIANYIDENRTVIISTHQVRDLESLIDHIVLLDEGQIIFYHNMTEITDKLAFKNVSDKSQEDVIYAEGYLGNKHAVIENRKGEDTRVDLELLFNAITTESIRIKKIFND